jgi:hypothetical protein
MDEYMKVQKFKAVEFTQWFDCGDLETYTKTRKNISRCFNIVSVTDENTIVKKSETQGGKIAKEAMWYLNIPNRLRVYTPQLIDYNLSKGSEQYELEYVNFSPLHELFVYEMPHLSDWKKIIDNIFYMVSKFKTYSNKAMFNVNAHAEDIFVNKLVERFEEIKKTPDLAKFICSDSFTVNGNVFPGIKKIMPQVVELGSCSDDLRQKTLISPDVRSLHQIHGYLQNCDTPRQNGYKPLYPAALTLPSPDSQ